MVLFTQTQLGLGTLMLTVILGLSSTGEGFKQELWMYTKENNSLYFHTHIPDLAPYSGILPQITRRCMTGMWRFYTSIDHQDQLALGTWSGTGSLICNALNATNFKSLRHSGANETLTDAVSLYSGPGYMNGDEILVTSNAKTDISVPIVSFVATGTAAWMLHEGKNLDGKSVCLEAPTSGKTIRFDAVPSYFFNFTTIGSIFKGCNAREIQLYRESHFM